ncbi:YdeI/OmpD-associated family protein [Leifsonia sp. NPDC058248]|uniref:YdeI/OmpD-associated family protein n=1 Tax=Leifsonia sp. NPDC058248 TaxID=3346402 RepID=UPI0036DDD6D7
MKIRAILEQHGKTATGVEVPDDVVEALGGGKRPPVRVTVNGYEYRSSVASMGGRYLLGLSAEVRAGAGVSAGDELELELQLDDAPREVEVPDDLAQALAASPAAQRAFEALSYSNRRRLVLAVDAAKTAETRQRRIAKTVADLDDAGR